MQPPSETGDLPTRSARTKARQGPRWVRVTLWVVGSLTVVLVGLAVGYGAYLNHSVDTNVKRAALMPTVGASVAPPPPKPAVAKNSLNLLLLGSDSRGSDQGRSDVIILAHISDDRSRVDLIHFPRDLYVDIPGRGKDKINAAYAYGGAPLLVSTLQNLINLPLDHVAVVDFQGFKAMTDAVGGVDVTVAESSPGFPKGVVHMNGDEGLVFVRDRHNLTQGDISRGQRQQAFIKAVMLKGLSKDTLLNPLKLADFINAATSNLTVDNDFDIGQMRSLALSMRSLRSSDIHFWTAPWTGVATTSGGASIVTMSEPQMAVLANDLKEDAMSSYSDPVSPTRGFSR